MYIMYMQKSLMILIEISFQGTRYHVLMFESGLEVTSDKYDCVRNTVAHLP
jgi:hypothetical protein